jgi:hypothetical protein
MRIHYFLYLFFSIWNPKSGSVTFSCPGSSQQRKVCHINKPTQLPVSPCDERCLKLRSNDPSPHLCHHTTRTGLFRKSISQAFDKHLRISMEEEQGSFFLSDQSLESLRQMASTVSELSAAVASINQSIER